MTECQSITSASSLGLGVSGPGVAGVSPGAPGPRGQQRQHRGLDPGPGRRGEQRAAAANIRNPLLQTSSENYATGG